VKDIYLIVGRNNKNEGKVKTGANKNPRAKYYVLIIIFLLLFFKSFLRQIQWLGNRCF
jgi:hypothetical protein